jgi:hypothetical protein
MPKIALAESDLIKLLDRFAPSVRATIREGTLNVTDAEGKWAVNLRSLPIDDRIEAEVAGLKIHLQSLTVYDAAVEIESRLSEVESGHELS